MEGDLKTLKATKIGALTKELITIIGLVLPNAPSLVKEPI